ncbi:hypothetical protein [Candidatus Jidaibacter acanthamoebae]|nr:hypothetical protein [Candidatus Jidaibacter acanthamoeba]
MPLKSRKLISKAIIFILYASLALRCYALDDTQAFCINEDLSQIEKDSLIYNIVINTYNSIAKDIGTADNIWDANFIKQDPELMKAIEEYKVNKRGHAAKKLRLSGLNATELHELLLKQGFEHQRKPLHILKNDKIFWLKDGTTTADADHKNIVPIDIYIHKDGSIVKVKPFGVPDKQAKAPRREAHFSKAVLKDLPCDCVDRDCKYNISYKNEAFKVTELGYAVPKSPSAKAGLKIPYNNSTYIGKKLNYAIITTLANLSHIKLVTNCPSLENRFLQRNKIKINELHIVN